MTEPHALVTLEPIHSEDLPSFARRMQAAFSIALKETFGECDPIPSEEEVREACHAAGAEAFHVVWQGQRVGGAVVSAEAGRWRCSLDLFFIAPEWHGHGLGLAAWRAIEAHYPEARVWQTITPYFERRNIHFYVNKCGFHIVEFFNPHHRDPEAPEVCDASGAPIPGREAYFRFEKVMRPAP